MGPCWGLTAPPNQPPTPRMAQAPRCLLRISDQEKASRVGGKGGLGEQAHSMIRSLGLKGDKESRPSLFTTWKRRGCWLTSHLSPPPTHKEGHRKLSPTTVHSSIPTLVGRCGGSESRMSRPHPRLLVALPTTAGSCPHWAHPGETLAQSRHLVPARPSDAFAHGCYSRGKPMSRERSWPFDPSAPGPHPEPRGPSHMSHR